MFSKQIRTRKLKTSKNDVNRFQETSRNVTRKQKFSVFDVTYSYSKFKDYLSFKGLPDIRTFYRILTFYNILARQASSGFNRARLNSQALALRDFKWWPEKGFTYVKR